MKKTPSLLAHPVSRRVVLLGGATALAVASCREETVGLLVDGLNPLHLLDEEGDEMPNVPSSAYGQIFDPMFLYGQSIVNPAAGGGLNTAALVNPHGLPMQLLEVRWSIYPLNNDSEAFYSITGMGVGVKMDMGDIPVCDAEVPVNAFGTFRDTAEPNVAQINDQSQLIFPDPSNEDVTCSQNGYRWRLKHPLYIPAGCVLTPTYSHLGQNQFPVVVDTVYICRTMPAKWQPPGEVVVPWVGSFNSTSFNNTNAAPASKDISSELDLVNPYSQPLEVARLTGQLSITWAGLIPGVGLSDEDFGVHRWQLGKVTMRSRSGDELARAATPFNQLFPYDWRVWDIPQGWTLRPGEFYKTFLTVAATAAQEPFRIGRVQYSMSVIGYRKLDSKTFEIAAKGGA